MHIIEMISVSPVSVALLLAPEGALFSLPQMVDWRVSSQVEDSEGCGSIATGNTDVAPIFIEGLTPDTDYVFECDLGSLTFKTRKSTAHVSAASFGVSASAAAQENAQALQKAIEMTPAGGVLEMPREAITSLPIFLKSDITFYLPDGATIQAPAERDGWPILQAHESSGRVVGSWEGLPEASFAALVTAIDCDGLIITGKGTIDGGGDRGDWWSWPKETREGARRPRTLQVMYSDGVTLSGFRVCNSPSWTVHPYRSDSLTCAMLRIENPPDSPNTDGLNPESCIDTTLVGIDFSVGDDCIAVKAGKRSAEQSDHLAPTKNLSVKHCRMQRGHGAVVLGSEMSGSIVDVEIEACEFLGTDRGLRLKTRRGRGGEIARVRMHNVLMIGVHTPFAANAFYFCDPDGKDDWVQTRTPRAVDHTTPRIHDIRLSGVTAQDVGVAAVALLGLPEAPIEDVSVTDFYVSYDPNASPQSPLMALGVEPVRHAGLLATFAQVTGEVEELILQKDKVI